MRFNATYCKYLYNVDIIAVCLLEDEFNIN